VSKRLPLYAQDLAQREALLRRTWLRLDPQFRTPNQVLGRRSTVGCVALEITQRCNLDCTLCYLSESSESVKDLPLSVVYERIEAIRESYGPGIGVQVTGGDPTLRRRDELIAIVRRLSERGLRPSLFTNGIRATRDLLEALAGAGLFDVAFHVDTTQRFKKYPTEESLNAVRREYIERARGLNIAVIFNTTVHAGNLEEVPMLVRFFLENSDVVGMASFQLQAVTGRGQWRERPAHVTGEAIRERIRRGIGLPRLCWDTALVGHPSCNRGAMLATVGGKAIDVLTDPPLYERFLEEFRHVSFDRRNVKNTARQVLSSVFRNPYWLARGGVFLLRKLWSVRGELWRREKLGKITFFVHSFMDAHALDPERIRNCAFMIMTAVGPVSMCQHNARRDDYILKSILLPGGGATSFDPKTGAVSPVSRSAQAVAAQTGGQGQGQVA